MHAEIVSDVLSVVPNLALADVRFLSPFQFKAFLRLAAINRTRRTIDTIYTSKVSGDALTTEWKALHRRLEDLTLEPVELPEAAKQQQREYEERKRRGDTFMQRKQKEGRAVVNPSPKRGRFSIRKGRDQDAGANNTPRRIMNAELPKGIRL